jgi:hypothetical protein
VHGVENAALHGFLTVAEVRQRAALDDRNGVFEIGFACEVRERQLIASFFLQA